jgi:hypothetical protein
MGLPYLLCSAGSSFGCFAVRMNFSTALDNSVKGTPKYGARLPDSKTDTQMLSRERSGRNMP